MYRNWRPYVSVAQRRAKANRYATQLAKQGRTLQPIQIAGRTIARTFWGKAWCGNLENYSDFENRLPRGRTYVRNGSVLDLQIAAGKIEALVSGSEIYRVQIQVATLNARDWQAITRDCSNSVDSLIDLLQGRLSNGVMQRLTRQKDGLFPKPSEIKIKCSCPDWAYLCKHAAAVLYGVGARLDDEPQLLFTLRQVDHLELIGQAVAEGNLDQVLAGGGRALAEDDLGALFGIDLEDPAARSTPVDPPAEPRRRKRATAKRPAPQSEQANTNGAASAKKKTASAKRAPAKAPAKAVTTPVAPRTTSKSAPKRVVRKKK